MIKYTIKQNKNTKSAAYGKYYAYPQVDETVDLSALAQHMEEHNTGFSEAMCVGVMTSMVKCIKEMLLEGKNVKIDNLAIFSVGIKNKTGGAASEEDFTTSGNITGVKLRARATGTLSNSSLNLAASIKKATTLIATSSSTSSSTGGSTGGSDGPFTITVAASPANGGTVSGGGSYASGATATLTAEAKSGYHFNQWSDGNTSATRTITVTADKSLTAIFVPNSEDGE